jgi:membrane fusion protein (multidrug efflux system)
MKIRGYYGIVFGICLMISCKKEQAVETSAPEVSVAPVLLKDVPLIQEYVGQTLGSTDIQIRARVQGFLTGMFFQEGGAVKKGQLLYTIDPLPYQSKLDQAKGQLAAVDAALVKAKNDLDRIKPLADMKAVSQRDLVAAQASYDAALAQTDASKAMVRNAEIELSYCRILSPIDGVIGISLAEVGDLVGTIQAFMLNTVSSTGNLRVRFSVAEQEYMDFRRKVGDRSKQNWEVDMILSDGTIHPHKGKINIANREIDPSTGTLTLEASFPNPEGIVRPGQFAKVRFVIETRKGALLIPQRAVTELQGTYQVFVVNKENKIEVKMVKAGQRYGEFWVIDSGLDPSDKVALIGNAMLRPGSVVTPVEVKSDSTKI